MEYERMWVHTPPPTTYTHTPLNTPSPNNMHEHTLDVKLATYYDFQLKQKTAVSILE